MNYLRSFLIGLIVFFLIYDVWWVLSDGFDFNLHIPFLFPLALVACAVITKVIDNITLKPSKKDRIR